MAPHIGGRQYLVRGFLLQYRHSQVVERFDMPTLHHHALKALIDCRHDRNGFGQP